MYMFTCIPLSPVNACVQLFSTLMLLGFVTDVYELLDFFACVWMITLLCQINCILYYQCSFMPKFMLHNNIWLPAGPHISTDFWTFDYCLEHWGSKYFEVVGAHGGPVISEGVQILQHYSEVIGTGVQILRNSWTGGELFQGVHFFFFRDSPQT